MHLNFIIVQKVVTRLVDLDHAHILMKMHKDSSYILKITETNLPALILLLLSSFVHGANCEKQKYILEIETDTQGPKNT